MRSAIVHPVLHGYEGIPMAHRKSIHYRGFLFSPCIQCRILLFQSASRCYCCGMELNENDKFVQSEPTEDEQHYLETNFFSLTGAGQVPHRGASRSGKGGRQSWLSFLPPMTTANHHPSSQGRSGFFSNRQFIKFFIFFLVATTAILFVSFQVQLPDSCPMSQESQALANAIRNRDDRLLHQLITAKPDVTLTCQSP